MLTLDLADLSGVVDDQGKAVWPGLREGLPTDGVLEVFHDLRTFGYDAADRDTGAWMVRWVVDPARTELVEPPPEADTPSAAILDSQTVRTADQKGDAKAMTPESASTGASGTF